MLEVGEKTKREIIIVPTCVISSLGFIARLSLGFHRPSRCKMSYADLESALAAGPQPIDEVVRILEKVLEGLAYAHGKGVVHRDIKLDNFVYENEREDAELKMIDFAHVWAGEDRIDENYFNGVTNLHKVFAEFSFQ